MDADVEWISCWRYINGYFNFSCCNRLIFHRMDGKSACHIDSNESPRINYNHEDTTEVHTFPTCNFGRKRTSPIPRSSVRNPEPITFTILWHQDGETGVETGVATFSQGIAIIDGVPRKKREDQRDEDVTSTKGCFVVTSIRVAGDVTRREEKRNSGKNDERKREKWKKIVLIFDVVLRVKPRTGGIETPTSRNSSVVSRRPR